jgi:diacylglycerol kinase family enzyme
MLVTHKAFRPDRIEIFQTKHLELTLKRKAYFQVDGEYLGRRSSIKARILPKIIHVMLPHVKELA